uniref:Uncharacterized protein n=1 Tax=Tanacetum cinerariifolium TaxID=118510 RepID=A0A6L2L354_TANCI|nr:hypothetical protein [Tanacetum cinerariifolium]
MLLYLKGVFGWILKQNLTDDWLHVVILINYMLSAEVIILESDYDSPNRMNSDDTWEPRKDVTKNTSKSVSVNGRKGLTSKKVSCSKSTKTKHSKDLKFFDDSSSDDQGSCSKGVVRGKPVESDVDSVEVIILESDYDSCEDLSLGFWTTMMLLSFLRTQEAQEVSLSAKKHNKKKRPSPRVV